MTHRRPNERREDPPRMALVAFVREQIQRGEYETGRKLQLAVERIIKHLRGEKP